MRAAAREELAAAFVALRTLALRIDLRLTDPAPGVPLLHLQVAAAQLWSHVAGQARGGQKWPLAHLA